jgi:hypothetical protein
MHDTIRKGWKSIINLCAENSGGGGDLYITFVIPPLTPLHPPPSLIIYIFEKLLYLSADELRQEQTKRLLSVKDSQAQEFVTYLILNSDYFIFCLCFYKSFFFLFVDTAETTGRS